MFIYLSVIISLTILVFFIHTQKVQTTKNTQLDGLSNIVQLKQIINLLQKHRGLTAAWLNGDLSKVNELKDIERKVNHVCRKLKLTKMAVSNKRWNAFEDHWARLSKHNSTTDVDNSFKQHTQMIANLLCTLEDEADRSHLNSLSLPSMPNIGYVWRELITSAESVGQSRAIGVGVATAGSCSSVDKIRLSFLEQHINKTSGDILAKLSFLDSFSTEHNSLLSKAQEKMTELTHTIEYELIQKQSVSISANEYFSLATDSITAIDNIFNNQIEQIKCNL